MYQSAEKILMGATPLPRTAVALQLAYARTDLNPLEQDLSPLVPIRECGAPTCVTLGYVYISQFIGQFSVICCHRFIAGFGLAGGLLGLQFSEVGQKFLLSIATIVFFLYLPLFSLSIIVFIIVKVVVIIFNVIVSSFMSVLSSLTSS